MKAPVTGRPKKANPRRMMQWRFPSTWPDARRVGFLEAAKEHWPRREHVDMGTWVVLFEGDWQPCTRMLVKHPLRRRRVWDWVQVQL